MYCPKCGMENSEGAEICRNCSQVMTMTASSPQGRTSALAITSLILGLLSFCTFFLTAPLAVILGIISLVMIAKSHGQLKGKGMAIAGIVVPIVTFPIVAIFMAIMMPALAKVHCVARQQVCSNNLKQLGLALRLYANDNNEQYPTADKWCDLLKPYYKDEKTLICLPMGQEQHYYAINPQAEPNSSADVVLLFETKGGRNQSGGAELLTIDNHCEKGCNILFNDDHVEFVRIEDINKLRWTPKQ